MLSDLDMLVEHVLKTVWLAGHHHPGVVGEWDKLERLSVGPFSFGTADILGEWEVRDQTIVPGLVIYAACN